jgi:hypothetical protein
MNMLKLHHNQAMDLSVRYCPRGEGIIGVKGSHNAKSRAG